MIDTTARIVIVVNIVRMVVIMVIIVILTIRTTINPWFPGRFSACPFQRCLWHHKSRHRSHSPRLIGPRRNVSWPMGVWLA